VIAITDNVRSHTVDTGVIRLDKGVLDLSVLDNQRIALASVVSEDRGAVEAKVQSLGELATGVTQEANLAIVSVLHPHLGR
jgi:hypothetical protein